MFFAIGTILRLFFIEVQGLSHDELSAWNRLGDYNFSQVISEGVRPDMHPAFMQVLLQYWTNIFGDSEWALRLPGTLFGLAAVLLTYLIGKRFFNRNVGLFASVLILLPCLPIIHSTLARPYAPGLFFIVLLLYGIFKLEDSRVNRAYFLSSLCIVLGSVGSIYTHYYAGMAAGLIGVSALFYVKLTRWRYLIAAGIVSLLLFIPHWDVTKEHLSRDGLGWLGAPEWYWFWDYLKLYFGDNYWFAGAFLLLIPAGLIFAKFKSDNKSRFLLLTFSGIYLFSHIVSIVYTPILREPGVFMLMPLLVLGMGTFFQWLAPKFFNLGFSVLAGFMLGNTLFTAELFENVHFEPFREITELVKKHEDEMGSEGMLKFCNVTNINYLKYYARKNGANLDFEMTMIEEIEEIHQMAQIIEQTEKDKVMLARTNRAQNVIQLEIIRNKFPKQLVGQQFVNANFNVWTLGKFSDRRFLKTFDEQNKPEWFSTWNSDSTKNEFVGALKIPVAELREKNSYVLIKTAGWVSDQTEHLNFVVVGERKGEMLKNGENAVLYQAWDQMELQSIHGKRGFFTAVEIPKKLKDSDEIHVYFWNRNFAQVIIQKPQIYVVPMVD